MSYQRLKESNEGSDGSRLPDDLDSQELSLSHQRGRTGQAIKIGAVLLILMPFFFFFSNIATGIFLIESRRGVKTIAYSKRCLLHRSEDASLINL